jgi:regulatory protein
MARRDHFRRELEEKLRSRGFEESEIAAAVERLLDLDLLNDDRVAARFVEVRAGSRGWGPRRLVAELRRRGLSAGAAEQAARLNPELAEAALVTALRKVEARAPEAWWRDGQRRARMVSSLVARGFEAETAIAAVSELAGLREKQHHALDDQ